MFYLHISVDYGHSPSLRPPNYFVLRQQPPCPYSQYSDMVTQLFAPFTVAKVELYHVLAAIIEPEVMKLYYCL